MAWAYNETARAGQSKRIPEYEPHSQVDDVLQSDGGLVPRRERYHRERVEMETLALRNDVDWQGQTVAQNSATVHLGYPKSCERPWW